MDIANLRSKRDEGCQGQALRVLHFRYATLTALISLAVPAIADGERTPLLASSSRTCGNLKLDISRFQR